MVKKTPIWHKTNTKAFPTKGEAEKFAIKMRSKKTKNGEKMRYDVNYDSTNGGFKVEEYYWASDAMGNLI